MEAGGLWAMYKALRTRNACKACALGMGGQKGGMVNELGHFPEVCKKSFQAQSQDMHGAIGADFFARHSIVELSGWTGHQLERAGRLSRPLYAAPGETHYKVIEWGKAYDLYAERLKACPPERSFFYFSGRSSNEAGFLTQLFARLYGTNNVNNCSFYCHQASGVGLTGVFGSGSATVQLEDVDKADLIFVIGANPASNHPRLMRSLMDLKRRGGRVIVVNPLKERGLEHFKVPSDWRSLLFGTRIADRYIQPHIGGDYMLFAGVGKALLEMSAIDKKFIDDSSEAWEEFSNSLRKLAWDDIESASGVTRQTIESLAKDYADSRGTVFCWAMGITHQIHGSASVRLLANLAMMRGMVGRPGAGLMPLRGHSNIQGIGTIGVTPKLKDQILENLEKHFEVRLPTSRGLDTMSCMRAAAQGEMDVAFCLGGNLYESNPDSHFAARAFRSIGMVAYLSTTLNRGHIVGRGKETLILPVLARDEEPEATTQESMFSYVRYSEGGPSRIKDLPSEIHVCCAVASRVLGKSSPVDWEAMRRSSSIRPLIAKVVPGMKGLADIDITHKEFHIPGRRIDSAHFPTASGKAKFYPVRALKPGPAELRLMTVRSEGQFNTIIYDEDDRYRGQERRDVIMMSREDMEKRGLKEDQQITIKSVVGAMKNIRVREMDVRPGNAVMYYPEANVLIPTTSDPESMTPAFKNTAISIEI